MRVRRLYAMTLHDVLSHFFTLLHSMAKLSTPWACASRWAGTSGTSTLALLHSGTMICMLSHSAMYIIFLPSTFSFPWRIASFPQLRYPSFFMEFFLRISHWHDRGGTRPLSYLPERVRGAFLVFYPVVLLHCFFFFKGAVIAFIPGVRKTIDELIRCVID